MAPIGVYVKQGDRGNFILIYLILKFSTMVFNKINRIIHIIPKINNFFNSVNKLVT